MFKNNEFGRSMVEMLGVLAVIGVLSVGGIAAYTTAMKSHKHNTIIDIMNKSAIMAASANAGEGKQLVITNKNVIDTGFGRPDVRFNEMPNEVSFMVASGDRAKDNAVLVLFAYNQKELCTALASKLSSQLVSAEFTSAYNTTTDNKSNCQEGNGSLFIAVKFVK